MKIIDLRKWCKEHLSDRQMTLILAFVIGFFASVAGYVLHSMIKEIQHLLTAGFDRTTFNWLYLLFPIMGIYLTSLFIKYVVKDNISHGITRVLYAISTKQSRLKGHNCWSSVVASSITIGFGGSVGAEAPIVLTGSAIGSNLAKLFKMDARTAMLLVGCGATAAISGIFKAPIAGLVFTLEVLMLDLTMASLLPILIASVTATCFSYIFVGSESLFSYHMDSAWDIQRVPPYIILGVFCGIVGLYFMRTMTACENMFANMKRHPYLKLALGGLTLSVLIFFFPSLYGEGYNMVNIFLDGKTVADWEQVMNGSMFYGHSNLLVVYVGLVVFTKVFATSATNGAGGCGGTFAPALFIGGFSGFFFARIWNIYQLGVYAPEKNFALMGMAGVMAGVMQAPLTGIFLIAELTAGYQLFIPLMIVCICAYLTINIFEQHSIYGMRLAREGKLLTHHTDQAILTLMSLDSIIDRQFTSVDPDMQLGKLINAISKSHTSFLPVLDNAGTLLGEIDITKIRHIMFRSELYNRFTVKDIMTPVPSTLVREDKMIDVMRKFEKANCNFLPVVDVNGHLEGYVSRTRMYSMYRHLVADFSSE
ncbi:MAG: chloride channel protein [Prevotella salivae]|nr:chloride channel protein [Segatella salivae]MBF1543950.1 chloride channel protein [Segatella salivae]MBF1560027.1 chloride channel protein [Segatella salivae]MBF1562839.1 chloride channel protein [Segatella salivae]MBF1574514.1 chloride channel protein [Segatella salivae]